MYISRPMLNLSDSAKYINYWRVNNKLFKLFPRYHSYEQIQSCGILIRVLFTRIFKSVRYEFCIIFILFSLVPMSVSNLQLATYNDSITATWDLPNGTFTWFDVTISSSMSENISCRTSNTTNLNYTFKSLKSAALYTVSVITYVEKDLNSSTPARKSDYTSKCQ